MSKYILRDGKPIFKPTALDYVIAGLLFLFILIGAPLRWVADRMDWSWKELLLFFVISMIVPLGIYLLINYVAQQGIASGNITREDVKLFVMMLLAVALGTRLGR